jgi:PAS domain S-box-containing protein
MAAGGHDGVLVAMAIAIAVLASYTALDLAARVRASTGWMMRTWVATAALAMGGGIWAMHFVAMLAFSMPGMDVGYDLGLTLASLVIAVGVTGVGFVAMARPMVTKGRLLAAGLFMGLGVVAMHYLGMAAMRMHAVIRYDPLWVGLSILIAIGAATAALWLAARNSAPGERIAAAFVMGAAIAGMHFAGMKAADFQAAPGQGHGAHVGQAALAFGVFAAAFLILFLALIAAMFDRRFARMAEREAMALRESEERFRSLYRGTPLPLHSLDREGRIEQVSNTWLDLLGYSRDEVIGRPLVAFFTEPAARRFQDEEWPALLANGTTAGREYHVLTKSGTRLDVVASARIEYDDRGALRHVLGGLTDVTQRKKAEEALRQAQKIEAVGHLTGGVAHDFNNLLAVIVGNLDLLRRQLGNDARLLRLADNALAGAQRGASLTQRLLAFARRQDLKPEAIALPRLVEGMTDLLQRSLGPRVRVETRFPPDLPPVHADAHQLEMAVLNLAVNARDAMPDGGRLTIQASAVESGEAGPVDLTAGTYVRLALTDQGAGMDAATLARATEPFFTTKGIGKGTGLGLSMVHGLAAQSGGRLTIDSVAGQGTTVTLYLPAASEPGRALPDRPDAADADALALPPLHILVVDDDPLVLANTAAVLEDLGHRVRSAASGEAALAEMAADGAVDLIVTDQLMPGMTGVQLATRIRAIAPAMPILIVSGFAEFGEDDAGQFPILAKPFDRQALAQALRDAVPSDRDEPVRLAG